MKLTFKKDGTYPHNYTCEVPDVMTIRDQFAMAALTGIISNNGFLSQINEIAGVPVECEHMAKCAYNIADAMMEARKTHE